MQRSGPGSCNVGPVAATTARSMTFLKFTSVPGHECEGRRILLRLATTFGGAQGIAINPRTRVLMGGADPRRDGYAIGW